MRAPNIVATNERGALTDWIDVKDSLPDEHRNVLVAISTGSGETEWTMAVMHRYQHWRWDGIALTLRDDGHENMEWTVTHWRPLPEGPR